MDSMASRHTVCVHVQSYLTYNLSGIQVHCRHVQPSPGCTQAHCSQIQSSVKNSNHVQPSPGCILAYCYHVQPSSGCIQAQSMSPCSTIFRLYPGSINVTLFNHLQAVSRLNQCHLVQPYSGCIQAQSMLPCSTIFRLYPGSMSPCSAISRLYPGSMSPC